MLVKTRFRPQPIPAKSRRNRRIIDTDFVSKSIDNCSQKSRTGGKERPVRLHCRANCQSQIPFSERNCRRGGRTERSRELLEGDDAEPRHDGGIAEVVRGSG